MVLVVVGAAAAALAVAVFLVPVVAVAFAAAFAFMAFLATLAFAIALAATAAVALRVEFLFGGLAHAHDLDGEVQVLAREFVVRVDHGLVARDGLDADGHRAHGRLCVEHHAGFHLVNSLEHVDRDFLRHALVIFAVAFGGDDLHVELVADFVTDHRVLEPHDDHVGTLDVLERFAAFGGIDDGSFVGGEGVVHLDYGLIGDFHGVPLALRLRAVKIIDAI